MKVRIIKRTNVDGNVSYVIQQRHFLFRWWWVDAWINSSSGAYCQDSWSTIEEAKKNLCYFDGSKPKEEPTPEWTHPSPVDAPMIWIASDNQYFPLGAELTSKENGQLIVATPSTPREEIVGTVSMCGLDPKAK